VTAMHPMRSLSKFHRNGSCATCTWRLLIFTKLQFILALGFYCQHYGIWTPLQEWDEQCKGSVLPGNQTGIQVLVIGLAKTGTRSMSRSLFEVGFRQSYHSEELFFHVWYHLVTQWFQRNGRQLQPMPRPYARNIDGLEVLNNITPDTLATALSRCQVDALAFDAAEDFIEHVYNKSPQAKVVLLSWRTWSQYKGSFDTFADQWTPSVVMSGLINSPMHFLPYGIIFQHIIDPLFGRQFKNFLEQGGPPHNQRQSAMVRFGMSFLGAERIYRHWFSGTMVHPETESEYLDYWQQWRDIVPRDRLFEWDMKKHTWEELCRFTEAPNCENRTGILPRAPNLFPSERDFPLNTLILVAIQIPCLYLNYQFLSAFCRILWMMMNPLLRFQPANYKRD